MIGLIVAAGMMGAVAQAPSPPVMPRKNFGNCLNKVVQGKAGDKLADDAFKAAAKAACATEETAFRTAWITYEVGMKTKRADAEQNAESQIEDYYQNASENYKEWTAPPK
jgi:hypothetical protein